ncbi:MAG TPA: stage III sporulation protein AB [Syntrophomonadaceae bacterium]|nr:stage III sporulation protein AB [Syntrophomonadaceae bacterium]HRX20170.1 stage III sporulation protein AB [Syntrophomonadaceae bacterium]
MEIKTLGICLIIAGFGMWGLLGARRIDKRVWQLKSLRMALGFLEKEITYMQTPLSLAMRRTAEFCENEVSGLFKETAKTLEKKSGITGHEAWQSGLKRLKYESDLKTIDLELLKSLGPQLGVSDRFEQQKYFILIQEELKLLEETALAEAESGRKIWSYGGFILGAVIVILLL